MERASWDSSTFYNRHLILYYFSATSPFPFFCFSYDGVERGAWVYWLLPSSRSYSIVSESNGHREPVLRRAVVFARSRFDVLTHHASSPALCSTYPCRLRVVTANTQLFDFSTICKPIVEYRHTINSHPLIFASAQQSRPRKILHIIIIPLLPTLTLLLLLAEYYLVRLSSPRSRRRPITW